MSEKSLCYFFNIDQAHPLIQSNHFKSLDTSALHGLFSFLHYRQSRVMVVGEMKNYGSRHSGLASVVQAMKSQAMALRHHLFFQGANVLPYPQGTPSAGGGILFSQGMVILWHLKSGSYSATNPQCHDEDPSVLHDVIQTIGLPAERFISVAEAEKFERDFLHQCFKPNGQYRDEAVVPQLVNQVSDAIKFTYTTPCDPIRRLKF